MEPNYNEEIKYLRAKKRVEKLKIFYKDIASYCIIIPVLIFINLKFSPHHHWFWFPVIGWGIKVLFHGLYVYSYNPFLRTNWEKRKIKELMEEKEK